MNDDRDSGRWERSDSYRYLPGHIRDESGSIETSTPGHSVCVCVESVPANIAQVAHILDNHFKTMKPKPVINELEMELFDDSCEESSDSGLENLVGNSSQ